MPGNPSSLIVVRVRSKGFFVLRPPAAAAAVADVVQAGLGMNGGYMAAAVDHHGDPQTGAIWVAWVEGQRQGQPYFDYRLYDGELDQAAVEAKLADQGEEAIDLQRCPVQRVDIQ